MADKQNYKDYQKRLELCLLKINSIEFCNTKCSLLNKYSILCNTFNHILINNSDLDDKNLVELENEVTMVLYLYEKNVINKFEQHSNDIHEQINNNLSDLSNRIRSFEKDAKEYNTSSKKDDENLVELENEATRILDLNRRIVEQHTNGMNEQINNNLNDLSKMIQSFKKEAKEYRSSSKNKLK